MALAARRDEAAVAAPPLLGHPFEDFGRGEDFELRFADRLALFEGHDGGDALMALADELGGAAQHLGAVVRRDALPLREAARGRRQRTVEIGGLGVRQAADLLARRRVENRLRFAPVEAEPFAVDEEVKLLVLRRHRMSSRSFFAFPAATISPPGRAGRGKDAGAPGASSA